MSVPITVVKLLNLQAIEKAAGDIGELIKSKQQHMQHIEKENQSHYQYIEKTGRDHGYHAEKEEQSHCHYLEKDQQSHNNGMIKSAFDTNSRIVKESFENSIQREEEDRRKITALMDRSTQELEKRNNDNMRFMSKLYSQREEYFNQIIDVVEQIRHEVQSSSKNSEDAFYEIENIKPKKEKIKNQYDELKRLHKATEVSIVKLEHDIDNFEKSLFKSDGAYEQIIKQNPNIKNGNPDENFFNYADFVLKKFLSKNKKEIELLEKIEDKKRIEKDLQNAEDILNELEHRDRNNLYKLISNITSARKLSGVMMMGRKINQGNEAEGVIDGVIVNPLLELTN